MFRLGHMRDTYCQLLRQSQELDSPTLLSRFRQTFDSEERLREMCTQRCQPRDKMTSLQASYILISAIKVGRSIQHLLYLLSLNCTYVVYILAAI
jgi:hypothetical protein